MSPNMTRTTVERNSRGYTINGRFFPRVTSVLQNLPKPALVGWAGKVVAEYAVNNKDGWASLPKADAIRLLKGIPNAKKEAAADRGSAVHDAIESYLAGVTPAQLKGDEPETYRSALQFLTDYAPQVLAYEVTLYSPSMGYAGTCDIWCKIDGEWWLLDWKTSRAVYADYALQLTAYALAEYAVLDASKVVVVKDVGRYDGVSTAWEPGGNKHAVPRMGVVHLTPKGYVLHEVVYEFAGLRKMWDALFVVHDWMHTNDSAMLVHGARGMTEAACG